MTDPLLAYARKHGIAHPMPWSYTGLLSSLIPLDEPEMCADYSILAAQSWQIKEKLSIDLEAVHLLQDSLEIRSPRLPVPATRYLQSELELPLEYRQTTKEQPYHVPKTFRETMLGLELLEPVEQINIVDSLRLLFPSDHSLAEIGSPPSQALADLEDYMKTRAPAMRLPEAKAPPQTFLSSPILPRECPKDLSCLVSLPDLLPESNELFEIELKALLHEDTTVADFFVEDYVCLSSSASFPQLRFSEAIEIEEPLVPVYSSRQPNSLVFREVEALSSPPMSLRAILGLDEAHSFLHEQLSEDYSHLCLALPSVSDTHESVLPYLPDVRSLHHEPESSYYVGNLPDDRLDDQVKWRPFVGLKALCIDETFVGEEILEEYTNSNAATVPSLTCQQKLDLPNSPIHKMFSMTSRPGPGPGPVMVSSDLPVFTRVVEQYDETPCYSAAGPIGLSADIDNPSVYEADQNLQDPDPVLSMSDSSSNLDREIKQLLHRREPVASVNAAALPHIPTIVEQQVTPVAATYEHHKGMLWIISTNFLQNTKLYRALRHQYPQIQFIERDNETSQEADLIISIQTGIALSSIEDLDANLELVQKRILHVCAKYARVAVLLMVKAWKTEYSMTVAKLFAKTWTSHSTLSIHIIRAPTEAMAIIANLTKRTEDSLPVLEYEQDSADEALLQMSPFISIPIAHLICSKVALTEFLNMSRDELRLLLPGMSETWIQRVYDYYHDPWHTLFESATAPVSRKRSSPVSSEIDYVDT